MLAAEIKHQEAAQKEHQQLLVATSSGTEAPFPTVSDFDLHRILDGVLENSNNSFQNGFGMQDSPYAVGEEVCSIRTAPRAPQTFSSQFPASPQLVSAMSAPRVPRRVPLVSGPLIGSPARILARRNDLSGFNDN